MKKQLTTDAEIWQALLAGSAVMEVSVYDERQIIMDNGNACYRSTFEPTDIARSVRKYYEVTENG